MYIDSHCHLQLMDYDKLAIDQATAVQNALQNQVETLLCVATHLDQTAELYQIANKYPNVKISIGLHPNDPIDSEPSVDDYLNAQAHPSVIAIGETGLDYYRHQDKIASQQLRFKNQINASKQSGKPLIVHTRAAKEDTLHIIRSENANEVGGVLHCFTEDLDMAMRAIDLNFYISFSGIVTFKNAEQIQEVALKMPLERMLIETDSPWLAPVPLRGQSNQPANVKYVAEFIAQLRGIDVATVARHTTHNFKQLFKVI